MQAQIEAGEPSWKINLRPEHQADFGLTPELFPEVSQLEGRTKEPYTPSDGQEIAEEQPRVGEFPQHTSHVRLQKSARAAGSGRYPTPQELIERAEAGSAEVLAVSKAFGRSLRPESQVRDLKPLTFPEPVHQALDQAIAAFGTLFVSSPIKALS